MDISKTSDVSNAVNSIANAINVVYANGPGAKRTISVYIPVNSALVYDNVSSLTMVVTNVSTTATGGTNKTVTANVNYKNVTITPSTLTKKWYTVTIEWPVNNNALGPITVTFS
ncbi:hypothetical protein [Methanobacterium paludis]|nr:hypothetical protein [Methanobacterium paludis]